MPPPPAPHLDQARALIQAGNRSAARTLLRKRLDKVPGDLETAKALARVEAAMGEDKSVADLLSRTAKLYPKDAEVQYRLGAALFNLKQFEQARAAYESSIRLEPREPLPYSGLANCQVEAGEIEASLETCRRATAACPGHPDAYFTLVSHLARLGRLSEAVEASREGLQHCPDDPVLLQAAIFAMNVASGIDPLELTALHKRIAQVCSQPLRPASSFKNSRDPDRPLRIGFMSCDFHLHSCAFFLLDTLAALDRSEITPFLYSTSATQDQYTERFRRLGTFREVASCNEHTMAAAVEQDAIDILIDLNGWVLRPQMFILSRRLAPVQMTYLGYPNTTGLASIDYRIVDAITDPPGSEPQSTEKLIRLPRCFICFSPEKNWPQPRQSADCNPPSAITFGSFNNIRKTNEEVGRSWARILGAVPNSRLLLKSIDVSEPMALRYRKLLASFGIPDDRLTILPYVSDVSSHISYYQQVDIALDTFPYNGTTTTCEALWMGAPVITTRGDTHRGRVGASLLTTIGHEELIAADTAGYERLAAQLAAAPARLAALHATLRQDMARSPLLDAQSWARAFESALREAWRTWCTSR